MLKLKMLILSAVLLLFFGPVTLAQKNKYPKRKDILKLIDKDYNVGIEQYKLMIKRLGPQDFPKTYFPASDKAENSGSDWWCSGFYPGTLIYLFEQSKDQTLLNESERILKVLAKEQYNKTTHDLGFMMYCSFGNLQKLEPGSATETILINSAKSLMSRFDPKVGCIKSWDSKPNDYLVIIDNMMNLELLFWATKQTGDSSYYKVALTHANTTMKNHFRSNYSSYHVLNYNAATGAVQQKKTAQGFADESAWARGQAWGLYGYTVMYRETRDKKYLEQAQNIARFILDNPYLPADKIPYWDFDAPNKPNALRDASAAAVMASALLELYHYSDKQLAQKYYTTAETIIKNLSSPQYLATVGTNGGFILKHSVGSLPGKTEIDVPLTYADYYFIEALKRYKTAKF